MGSRAACVTDASVWIDLHAAGLVGDAFALPFEFCAPDVILAELRLPSAERLQAHGLSRRTLSGEQVERVLELARKYRAPSRADLFALGLARDLSATLLTQDRALRRAAESEGVRTHGTLWVLDEMIQRGVITPGAAAAAIGAMKRAGSRLPDADTDPLLRRWSQ